MAGNNGASTPEDDDPFGYLYEDGRAAGAQPPGGQGGYGYPGPAAQPGVPRTSYNQVRTVGERQYGQQVPQQQAYGQPQAPYGQPNQQYGQPNAQYAAPETYPGGAPTAQVPHQGGRGSGGGPGKGGPNTKGLLIGAVAVVAVVLIGIGAALMTGDGDKGEKKDDAATSSGAAGQVEESPKPEQSASSEAPVELPKQDAASLKLGGDAGLDNTVKGAKSNNGQYINLNAVGRSATWSVEVPQAGEYTLFVTYGVPGKDAKTSLTVNSEDPRSINMKNFANAPEGDLEKGWTTTYAYVNLTKGPNTLMISCNDGDQCDANLDQLSLKAGHQTR
ncbi:MULTISPECIES: carbohydrate-binding protein [unclassified Streptomyces]|uniref:carbohydrate-binding protein n=1 Tax=unclassified Streptomyces TaxID=2593676 RepID=UPI002253B1F3|nr:MULTISPECIES: carbohydrate-binding protein [unclassified Streptomyces]MCX5141844.1 carbohydrate-binding protein [Streptomyces sp. NBC_00338]WRZ66326.1 carbohydrate-binding protein [Streptomyces sp. NBC_01257]WSU60320.1 carbohydrate-binding protein [Streptomyces sp. NBC_01104]